MKQFWQQRKWWIISGVTLAGLIGLLVLPSMMKSPSGSSFGRVQAQSDTSAERVEAFIGDLSNEATAAGEVVAQREAALAMLSSGTISDVYVRVGDAVHIGDPLVQLDVAELERTVESARQALVAQEANLETLTAPPTAAELASVQASVTSAQAALDDLLDGPGAEELAAAEASLRAAQADLNAASARLSTAQATPDAAALQAAQLELDLAQQAATTAAERHSTILVTETNRFLSEEDLADLEFSARVQAQQANADLAAAQQAYDDLVNGNPSSVASAQASVASAAAQRDSAQAQLDLLLEGPTQTQLASAKTSLTQAQLRLEQLQNGPSDAQRTQAEVAVEKARIALQRAERGLADATLVAPFDGVVTIVNAQPGETTGGVQVEMYDPTSLEVVLDVDEVDIAQVQPGQEAVFSLETWPDDEIQAEVASIMPEATAGSDLVTYQVYLTIGETSLPVRVGMTANASLMAETLENVLLLSNAAIQADRSNGTYSVVRVVTDENGEDAFETTPVTIGLRDSRYTQITSGLEAGDQVVIGDSLPLIDIETEGGPGNGGGPFGGGGTGN
ncbi:MAG: HlyD family efflux transporter periplasmic adaptor subunit [Chloroflexota bacterium]